MIGAKNNKIVESVFTAGRARNYVMNIYNSIKTAYLALVSIMGSCHFSCSNAVITVAIVWVLITGNIDLFHGKFSIESVFMRA